MDIILAYLQNILQTWQFITPERFANAIFALLLASIVGLITGPRAHSAVPAFWRVIDLTFGLLGGRLDRTHRSEGSRIFRGFIIALLMIVFSAALGLWLESFLNDLKHSRPIEILMISLCLSSGAVWTHILWILSITLSGKKSEGIYLTFAKTSRFDLSGRDTYTLTRTGAELLVRLFDRAVVSPLIWYILAGLPGLFLVTALSAYTWKNSYDGTWNGTGSIAMKLEKLMGFVPAIFAASLLAMTTLMVPNSKPWLGMHVLLARSQESPYEQGGAPLDVLAHTLGMALGGPMTNLNGRVMKRRWAGPDNASAQLNPGHLKRVLYMIILAHIFFLAALLGGLLYSSLFSPAG